jgi:UDP-N-acetylglucosamine 3-dehydrogenase
MPDPVRVAVLGYGGAGRMHVKRLRALPDVRVTHVFDPELAVEDVPELEPAGIRFTSHLEDALEGVDAVSICTPDHTHFRYAQRCIEAGLPTLVEKPLFDTLEQCDAAERLAADAGVVLGVHHQMRYVPAFRHAYDRVRDGALGRVLVIAADYMHDMRGRATRFHDWRVQPEHPQNIVLGGLSHTLDLVCWIAGEWPESVAAFAGHRGWSDYPDMDTVTVSLRFPSGIVAHTTQTIASRGPQRNTLAVYGTEGQIHDNVHVRDAGTADVTRWPPLRPRRFSALIGFATRRALHDPRFRAYPLSAYEHDLASERLLADFVDAVRGRRPFPVSFADGIRVVRLCHACIESYRSGAVVRVPEGPSDTGTDERHAP